MTGQQSLRVSLVEYADSCLWVKQEDGEPLRVYLSETQQEELHELSPYLKAGNTLYLINIVSGEEEIAEVEVIILEPDYLVDISSLAECFKPYGDHPLNYSLQRLQTRSLSAPILLGNTANFFMDELINEDESQPVDYQQIIRKVFKASPFEFTACTELKDAESEKKFFAQCFTHFQHIAYMVRSQFPRLGIPKEQAILEPSFISNQLGLQGRLDVLFADLSAFIELKSGRAFENFRNGGAFLQSAENHSVQVTLYLAMLEFSLGCDPDAVHSYLLYSKYPVLSREKHSRKRLYDALRLRNQLVAREYFLAENNHAKETGRLLGSIYSQQLNVRNMTGKLFEQYLRPAIDRFPNAFNRLDELERAYFLRLYTFIQKELWLSKTGSRAYEGEDKPAVLWNASPEDKLQAGEILYDLRIEQHASHAEGYTITLTIPVYDDLYLPNFRPGDAIVLYECNTPSDTVNHKQVFKGTIETLTPDRITIRLRYRQKNLSVWNHHSRYAVMHDYMDIAYTGMFRGLSTFLEANPERKDLLLCRRKPEPDECFLLIGPPGTGKTSVWLKELVEKELQQKNRNLLLLSYTNRAVDEICETLLNIDQGLPFIRIGSELSCHASYRPFLLENQLKDCTTRKEVSRIIHQTQIYTGTVASLWNKPELFQLKQFDLAVIDEATQLLEAHLVGLFCLQTPISENAIRRFVLIGDHKQLPAVVLQNKEESKVDDPLLNYIGMENLSESLFQRLYKVYREEGWSDHYRMLNKQGRMHPDICSFPSTHFYNGELGCVGLPHQLEKSTSRRLHYYDILPCKEENNAKTNRKEAECVVDICKRIFQEEGSDPSRIGIITPFRNQIALIRKLLHEAGIEALKDINVDTVERYQGSQRDIIIYSFCIRTQHQLKALPDVLEEDGKIIDRKLNVALTRARKQLHIIGNRKLLSQNPLYKALFRHLGEDI